jgi:preprotein translocase subunit SecF
MSDQTPSAVVEARGHGIRDLASRLYRGEAGVDVVGKRKYYYLAALVILLVGILTFSTRWFNVGVEFAGGSQFTIPAKVGTIDNVRAAVTDAGANVVTAQSIGTNQYVVKTSVLDPNPTAASTKAAQIKQELAQKYGISANDITEETISGAWGGEVTKSAILGASIFLVVVMAYMALTFREWRMSIAALAALVQNLVLTATIYSLVGFEVTPSTVIGFLTILGFALYDVVVVFDKVRENTRGITGSTTRTYGEAANLAVNQTLMRSINTAVVSLLPVGAILFIGAGLLGAGTLKDLGLVIFIGMLVAVYSSIFLATPVLVDIKEREPKFKLHRQRVLARRNAVANAAAAKATPANAPTGEDEEEPAVVAGTAAPRTGARPQTARKRTPSGARPGTKSGGSRSGGRKR